MFSISASIKFFFKECTITEMYNIDTNTVFRIVGVKIIHNDHDSTENLDVKPAIQNIFWGENKQKSG